MDLWDEANSFSELNNKTKCPFCGKDAISTIIGNHFKCGEFECSHLFNQDSSVLPEGIICYCDNCRAKEQSIEKPGMKKVLKAIAKKLKGKKKKTK